MGTDMRKRALRDQNRISLEPVKANQALPFPISQKTQILHGKSLQAGIGNRQETGDRAGMKVITLRFITKDVSGQASSIAKFGPYTCFILPVFSEIQPSVPDFDDRVKRSDEPLCQMYPQVFRLFRGNVRFLTPDLILIGAEKNGHRPTSRLTDRRPYIHRFT